jgi:hypothetical protein
MTRKVSITCPQCGDVSLKPHGAVNRANKIGAPVYCGKRCAGLGRRKNKTAEQKKAEKAEYDREYRKKNKSKLKGQKKEYHHRTYDPDKARAWRQTEHRKNYHNEYCRRPENREKDRIRYAKRKYGEFFESARLLIQIEEEVLKQSSRYEVNLEAGKLNKSNKRKRDYERRNSEKTEIGPLGNIGKLA